MTWGPTPRNLECGTGIDILKHLDDSVMNQWSSDYWEIPNYITIQCPAIYYIHLYPTCFLKEFGEDWKKRSPKQKVLKILGNIRTSRETKRPRKKNAFLSKKCLIGEGAVVFVQCDQSLFSGISFSFSNSYMLSTHGCFEVIQPQIPNCHSSLL